MTGVSADALPALAAFADGDRVLVLDSADGNKVKLLSYAALLAAVGGGGGGAGSVWRTGSGAPSDALGADGDFYLDSETGDVYQKAGGAYALVSNLTGPPGEPGSPSAVPAFVSAFSTDPSPAVIGAPIDVAWTISGGSGTNAKCQLFRDSGFALTAESVGSGPGFEAACLEEFAVPDEVIRFFARLTMADGTTVDTTMQSFTVVQPSLFTDTLVVASGTEQLAAPWLGGIASARKTTTGLEFQANDTRVWREFAGVVNLGVEVLWEPSSATARNELFPKVGGGFSDIIYARLYADSQWVQWQQRIGGVTSTLKTTNVTTLPEPFTFQDLPVWLVRAWATESGTTITLGIEIADPDTGQVYYSDSFDVTDQVAPILGADMAGLGRPSSSAAASRMRDVRFYDAS